MSADAADTSGRARRTGLPILVALAVAGLVAALVFTHIRLRTDMADFLPEGQTTAARFMLRELRSGSVASLILIGVEGAPPEELARISRELTGALDRTSLFSFVSDGAEGFGAAEQDFLFRRRYLLSSVTTPDAFAEPALRQDLQNLLAGLQSSAAPLVQKFGLADPPGAFPALLRDWVGASHIGLRDGVWFAGDRDRALIVARTRANGMDVTAEGDVAAAIDRAFSNTRPGPAQLLKTGPAIFAEEVARAMRSDVETLSFVSSAMVALLLLWRFRSLWVLAAIAVPVVLSAAVAALAVQLVFGFVHGVALGFGMTMLGVTVDYPVLLVGHRKQGEEAAGTLRRIGPTLVLAVITAALGLTGMLFSGLAGLAQLGLFAATGVLAAAAATRWLLPRLIVLADLAPVSAGAPAVLLRVEKFREFRMWGLLPIGVAAGYLLWLGGPSLENDMSRLSPVAPAALALDDQMRSEIGAPDEVQLVMLRGDSAEDVLRREEAARPQFEALVHDGSIGGIDMAAQTLPSIATQKARQAALPDTATLTARLDAARAGTPFRAQAFQPFLNDVAASATMAPVLPGDITDPLLASRLQSLLFQRDGEWFGVIFPSGVTDASRLAAVTAGLADATFVDMKTETNGMVSAYTGNALRWLGYGAAAAMLALLIGLRDVVRAARVAASVAAAVLVTVAVLAATGTKLSLIHIVSLQLVGGVGLDYALFFARRQLDDEERARTLRTLVTCNAMTLLTFGLLALCRTPLLRDIGATVVIGVVGAMIFSFLFAGQRPRVQRA